MPFNRRSDVAGTAWFQIRLTPAEKQRLREEAELAAMTMSEYARRRLLGKTVTSAVDRIMVNELRRLGGLLKHTHNLTRGVYSQTTADILGDIRVFIEGMGRK
jgi:hypothetical protein